MADYKTGGVPTPDYDSDDINYIDQKTEITEDLFVYGDAYAQSFNKVEISVVGSTPVSYTHLTLPTILLV